MALRGDLTPELEKTDRSGWDYQYAIQLIRELRETDNDFCIGAACYPEIHPESPDQKEDIRHLKEKTDAGADFLTTQMVFDNNLFFNFMYKLREAGVTVPVIPGNHAYHQCQSGGACYKAFGILHASELQEPCGLFRS